MVAAQGWVSLEGVGSEEEEVAQAEGCFVVGHLLALPDGSGSLSSGALAPVTVPGNLSLEVLGVTSVWKPSSSVHRSQAVWSWKMCGHGGV